MMAWQGGEHLTTDGGPPRHVPVMLNEVLRELAVQSGDVVVDGTFGAGGYTTALLGQGATVVAIDRDPAAIAAGQALVAAHKDRLILRQGRFSRLDKLANDAGYSTVDGVVLDVGVSSMQIDTAERGFSFQKSGPLDMRMGAEGLSAADVANTFARGDLVRIIGILGEERQASRIAGAIEKRRLEKPFDDTLDLAHVIEATIGRHPRDKIHPATRTFQALRIFVNRELDELADGLLAAERVLRPGGRLVVVSFHSLEDRIVKRFLADRAAQAPASRHAPQGIDVPLTFERSIRNAVAATAEEAEANPRARSARLRAAVRTDAPARAADRSVFGLPDFSSIGKRNPYRGAMA
jgi:16S rRNA (cytosine1402-N4)-methyltransferase